MLAYDIKTYERFFWKFYKESFKKAVKGFFRANEHQRSEFLNYFKYLQAYKTAYSFDDRKNNKWGEFMVTWVKTHSLEVWTTGFVFHYHEKPVPVPTEYEELTQEELIFDMCIRAYNSGETDLQRSGILALSRWVFNLPQDLYDELALP